MKEDADKADPLATRAMPAAAALGQAIQATSPHPSVASGSGSGRLDVRCPNCHQPTEVAVDTTLTDLTCSACGSHFSLVDQSKATRTAPSLSKLGRFELIERIGVGGFGSVWKARDKELDRTVAIKIPRASGMSGAEQEQFFREARAAAQLHHPSIVSVHEVGRDGDSIYIVSDFVRGVTLGDWLTGQQLTSREAAELCAKIADALHHAHEQGVIHRDLKPANVMIDGDGQPHLMDFGLARREVGEVSVTVDGQILGTPAYMSPEQAQGEAHTADRRSDVYSLGVILFQLLTGELPFRGNARMLMHQVIHDEPPSPRKLNANIKRDLETITLKCLEKSPDRRFPTAHHLADELRRFLRGEPILSRPIGRVERAWRWTKRNPRVAVLTASVAILLFAIAALSLTGFAIAKRQQLAAEEAAKVEFELRQSADKNRVLAEGARAESIFEQANALHLAGRGQESREKCQEALTEFERLGLSTLQPEVALFRSYQSFIAPIQVLKGHSKGLMAVAFAPDNIHAFTASLDGTIICWDVRTGRQDRVFLRDPGPVCSLAPASDGKRLLSGNSNGKVNLWDAVSGRVIFQIDAKGNTRGVAFSPDGKKIVTASWGGKHYTGDLRVWDATNGAPLRAIPVDGQLGNVVVSPDSQYAAVAVYDGTVRVFDLQSGAQTARFKDGLGTYAIAVAYSPDGKRILSASDDHMARLWDPTTSKTIQVFKGHTEPVRGVAFSADGQRVFTGSLDGSVRVWDAKTGDQLAVFCDRDGRVRGISLSPDGFRLISAGLTNSASVWDVRTSEVITRANVTAKFPRSINVDPEGQTVFLINQPGNVAQYDCATLKQLRTFQANTPDADYHYVAPLPDGKRFLVSDPACICDSTTGEIIRAYPNRHAHELAKDGHVALSIEDHKPLIWNVDTGNTISELPFDANDIERFQFSPDATHALSAHTSGKLCYWDVQSGKCVFDIRPHGDGPVSAIVFSPDGKFALSGGQDQVLRLWELPSARLVREYKGCTGVYIVCVGISIDGRFIYAAEARTIRAWDLQTARLLPLTWVQPVAIVNVPKTSALLVYGTNTLSLFDLRSSSRYAEFEADFSKIRTNVPNNPKDPKTLLTLAHWYAFRGVFDWAADSFEKARAAGGEVSSLELARCYWQLDRREKATREFRKAIERKEAPVDYLSLCLQAVESPIDSAPIDAVQK